MAKSLLFVCSLQLERGSQRSFRVSFRNMLQQRDERLARQVKVVSAGLSTKEDIEAYLTQKMAKFLRYLQQS